MYFNAFKCCEGKFLFVSKSLTKCGVGKKISNNRCAIFSLTPSFLNFLMKGVFVNFPVFFYDFNFLKIKEIFPNSVRILGVLMI